MIYILETDKKEKEWIESAMKNICFGNRDVVVANAKHINEILVKKIKEKNFLFVMYAIGGWDKLSPQEKKLTFSILSWENVGTIPGYPFSVTELSRVYYILERGKTVNNIGAVSSIRQSLIETLKNVRRHQRQKMVSYVEDMYGVRLKKSEFQNVGEREEVLSDPLLFNGVVRGVFCDIEQSLFTRAEKVNRKIVRFLHSREKENKEIILWTTGSIKNARRIISENGIKNKEGGEYLIISKRHYAGRVVEWVVDPLRKWQFEKSHRIFPMRYTESGA